MQKSWQEKAFENTAMYLLSDHCALFELHFIDEDEFIDRMMQWFDFVENRLALIPR